MPKVTVIIPNYNHARYLNQRIKSVLNQTYQDFEVIILDDYSTDNSKEVLGEYAANPKVSHVIFNETNSGSVFKQWKKGIGLAKGEYIWIAETDDFCESGFLATAIDALESSYSSLFFCQSDNVDENNNKIGDFLFWTESLKSVNWDVSFTMDGSEFIKKSLCYKNVIINASAVVFRKKALGDLPDDITDFKCCGDWKTWLIILQQPGAKIAYSPLSLNSFRTHVQTTRNLDSWRKLIIRKVEDLRIKTELKEIVKQTEYDKDIRRGYFELLRLTSFSRRAELVEITKKKMFLFSLLPFITIKVLLNIKGGLNKLKHLIVKPVDSRLAVGKS